MKTKPVQSSRYLRSVAAMSKKRPRGLPPYGPVLAPIRAILCCGIALCAAAPPPGHAQSVVTANSSPATVYVDCAEISRGNGSATHPYWRITDALDKARALRRASPRPIAIRIAPGICSGNFEPQPTDQTIRPPELLPLVLNVPDLTLHGAGVMEYAGGFPVAARAGTATTVTVDTPHLGNYDNTVIYVGPTTDGGRADGTVIEGLVIDDAFNSWDGMIINRSQRITIRNNVVEHVNFNAIGGSEFSGRIVGNVVHDGIPGMFIAAGTTDNPSRLYIGGNSATMNQSVGVILAGTSIATDTLDMGANPLEELPYPINPTASQMGNHIDVELAGNDVSNNPVGLRFMMLGADQYPYAQTGNISASVHDNRFIDNSEYPFAVDQGFVFRATSNFWTDPNPDPANFPEGYLGFLALPFITHGPFDGPFSANVSAIFEDNVWKNPTVVPSAPALLTFSYIDVYLPATGAPDPSLVPVYTYMRNSRLNFVDHDGLFSQPGVIRDDLRIYDPLDGVTVLNNQTRIRQ
jgi:hypothetical protein